MGRQKHYLVRQETVHENCKHMKHHPGLGHAAEDRLRQKIEVIDEVLGEDLNLQFLSPSLIKTI